MRVNLSFYEGYLGSLESTFFNIYVQASDGTKAFNFGEGNVSPLQYSCLGNPMDREIWQATAPGIAKESNLTTKKAFNLIG